MGHEPEPGDRLLTSAAAGSRHVLAEFTREDIADMIAKAPALRF